MVGVLVDNWNSSGGGRGGGGGFDAGQPGEPGGSRPAGGGLNKKTMVQLEHKLQLHTNWNVESPDPTAIHLEVWVIIHHISCTN